MSNDREPTAQEAEDYYLELGQEQADKEYWLARAEEDIRAREDEAWKAMPLAERIRTIVHAFDDHGRRNDIRELADEVQKLVDNLERAQRERDEARAELESLKDTLDDFKYRGQE
jgi:phage shock protein A